MVLLWVAVVFVLIALVQQRDRVRRLEDTINDLRRTIDRLTRRLDEGTGTRAAQKPQAAEGPLAKPTAAAEPPRIRIGPIPQGIDPAMLAKMAETATPTPPAEKAPAANKEPGRVATAAPPIAPPRPPSVPRTPRPSAPEPARPKRSFDWEALIGVKLFAIVASLALFLAGGFFVSYSMEHGWLTPPIQFGIGIAAGVVCLVLGELKSSRRYAWTADALDAAGIALLYVVFFAAFARWHLVGSTAAFVLFILATVVAVLLAIRRASLLIALLGLIGGFASPAIVATGQNNPIGLFGYLLLLNAGLAWVAYKKRWPVLTAISLGLTTVYQWGWVSKFLTSGDVPLAAGIFLIFPILSFVALALNRPATAKDESPHLLFAHAARVGAALPLLFSIYLAAVPAYGARFGVLFGFLFCIDAGLFAVALFQGPRLLHLLGALSTLMVFVIWLAGPHHATAWPGILVAVAAFVVFYLTAPLLPSLAIVRRRFGDRELGDVASRAVLAAPLLLFVFPALAAVEPRTAAPALLFGVLLALLAACAWYAIAKRQGAVHFVAAFFVVAAEAIWSSKYLTPERLVPALVVYVVFGLFFIGAPVLARRRDKPLEPRGAGAALALASIGLLFYLAGGAVAQAALWGIALLLGVLTIGLFTEASASRSPVLAIAGTMLAWLVLAVWWMTATVSIALIPALSIVGGYALLTMAGSFWSAHRQAASGTDETRGIFRNGAFVGLAGHLFLFFVASQPTLSVPPGPLFAVLGVLTAAAGVGALYVKRGDLFLAAIIASAAVVFIWQFSAEAPPWPTVAIVTGAALITLSGVWLQLAK